MVAFGGGLILVLALLSLKWSIVPRTDRFDASIQSQERSQYSNDENEMKLEDRFLVRFAASIQSLERSQYSNDENENETRRYVSADGIF